MLGLIIPIIIGLIVGFSTYHFASFNIGWSIFCGIIIFILLQLGIGLLVRRKMKKLTAGIQTIMEEGQEQISRKVQFLQKKPTGGIKTMQKRLEKDQNVFLQKALEETNKLEPLCNWGILVKKQISTMRMQFYYQMKSFKKVDELLSKSLFVDPMSISMKIARQYKNGDIGYEKTFKKKVRKFKGDNAVILYALYSWILVKEGEYDKARNLLIKGKNKTANEVLTKNWECLANDKVNKFSNAALGDQWYALYLEEPKAQKPKRVKQQQHYF